MGTVPRREPVEAGTVSGRVLICGTGFLVAAGMWAILGFFRYEGGMTSAAIIDVALTAVHLVVGILVYRRIRAIWYVGLALCGVAMAATLPNQYYLPLVTNGVIGALLYLSRSDFPDVQVSSQMR